MLDMVGELRYYTAWRASSASRVRILASDLDPDTGLPTGECETPRVNEIVKTIAGGPLGMAQFLKRGVECLTVPGEHYVAILATDTGERWLVLTLDEIKDRGGRSVSVLLPEGGEHEIVPGVDTMYRVWNPRPRKASEADSPVRASMASLREIVSTTKTIANASKSRLIGNGIVFVPNEMSLPASNAPTAEGGLPLEGVAAVEQIQEMLFQVAMTAYEDEHSQAALVPIFASVAGDMIGKAQHMRFDNTITDIAIKTRNDAIARLAMGLDVSPERLLGLGSNSNHWSAWQIGDEDVRLHIIPPVETICSALTDHVLRPLLVRERLDPEKFVVWYDAAPLTADPDLTDEATNAFDRGAITAEAYREFLGLGDTGYDLTTLEGWQEWARDRVSQDPDQLQKLLPLLDTVNTVIEVAPPPPPALEQPAQEPPPGQTPPVEQNPQGPPNTEQTQRPGQASLPDGVIQILAARALELAGKRRRTHADHARLRDVPMHETHRYMTPVDAADVPRLIKGWDAALEDEVLISLGFDPDTVRDEVRRQVRDELTRQMVDA